MRLNASQIEEVKVVMSLQSGTGSTNRVKITAFDVKFDGAGEFA